MSERIHQTRIVELVGGPLDGHLAYCADGEFSVNYLEGFSLGGGWSAYYSLSTFCSGHKWTAIFTSCYEDGYKP